MAKTSASKRIFNTLTSMKFAIIVLIVLAVLAILVILFQDSHPTNFSGWQEHYASHLPAWKYNLYNGLQLFTPYRSWWFVSLLTLLCVSIFLCSVNNAKRMFKLAFLRDYYRPAGEIAALKHSAALKVPEGTGAAGLKSALRKKAYRTFVREENGITQVFARQGGLSRIGPFLSHIGLLLLFVGGLAVAIWGKTELLWGEPGSTVEAAFADHGVQVDDFKIFYNDEGKVKDYVSWLTVLDEEGNPVLQKKVEVNQPLRFHGVSYYQSSYQTHPRKLRQAVLEIRTPLSSTPDTVFADFEKKTPLHKSGLQVRVADFASDFRMTQNGVVSGSRDLRNPALLIQLFDGDEEIGHQWLFANFPSFHSSGDSTMQANLLGFEPLYYTGLQASTNPASSFIWAGFAIMTLGICLVFFLNHKQIWAVVTREGDKSEKILVAGTSHKYKDQFKREFDAIVARAKESGTLRNKPIFDAADRAAVLER